MALEVGEILEGKVTGLTNFGAFVELEGGKTGMVHISEVANTYVKEIRDFIKENDEVKVKVLSVGDDGKISLSMKQAVERPTPPPQQQRRNNFGNGNGRPGGFRPRQNTQPRQNGSPRPDNFDWNGGRRNVSDSMSFEDMMSKFKQTSDEKLSDLKRTTESKHGGFSRRGNGNGNAGGPSK